MLRNIQARGFLTDRTEGTSSESARHEAQWAGDQDAQQRTQIRVGEEKRADEASEEPDRAHSPA
jgi:hypothetical protein